MNNTIEIPREVFENIFFANGGTKKEVAKELAGNYQAPLTKDRLHLANAEVEKNEYVFDSKGIRKFGGNTHEKGGTPVKLEEGSRILSDHLKIGADLAKELTKSLKLPFRATDTYAKALDRFNNASDLPKLNKEIEDLILKMDSKKSKDKTTFALNNEFLNNTLNAKNKQKEPLEKEMAGFFDMLFQRNLRLWRNLFSCAFSKNFEVVMFFIPPQRHEYPQCSMLLFARIFCHAVSKNFEVVKVFIPH